MPLPRVPRKETVSVRLAPTTIERLDRIAVAKELRRSDLTRRAVEQYIDRAEAEIADAAERQLELGTATGGAVA